MRVKRLGIGILTALAIACGGIFRWSSVPVTLDPKAADPAVTAVNAARENPPPFREDYLTHDGQRLHYVYAGAKDKDIVLFIHGFPSFWLSFIRQMQSLEKGYRVVAIDGLGAGLSEVPTDTQSYKLEAMGAHLLALIDALGADKVHLVGHDWGAAFAMGFAQRYPHRVHTVTGLSAPPQSVILELLMTDPTQREVFSYVEVFKKANAALLRVLDVNSRIWADAYEPLVTTGKLSVQEGALFRDATANPKRINAHINWYRANIPAANEIVDGDYWPSRKARITVPALFIWGSDDRIITSPVISELTAIADDMTLLSIENVGHWPHIAEAETVNATLINFLTEHQTSASKLDAGKDVIRETVRSED